MSRSQPDPNPTSSASRLNGRSSHFSSSNWSPSAPTESWAMVTPGEVLRSFRRRLPSILFTTVLVTVAVVALLVVWPNQYRSEGLMYVRLGRGALAVDPTTKATQSVSMQESRTAEVVSIGEMIGSREIAERAVERIGVDKINQPRTWIDRGLQDAEEFMQSDHQMVAWLPKSEGKTVGELTPEAYELQLEREQAIKKVSKAIDVQIAKNGYTVAVAGKGDDPLLIQTIVQAVMDEYGRYHVEAHSVDGSESFFEKRAKQSRDTALATRRALQETRNEMGWLSAASAEETLRERIIDLEMKLNTADSELAEAISQAEELRRQLDGTKEWVPVEVTLGIANAAGDQMRSQLYDVQIQDGEELARVSPNHPRYKRLQEKMQQSSQLADAEREDREERREAINPVYQELETQFQTVRAKAVGLKSRREAVSERLEATQLDLRRLNGDATRLAELTWEAELAEDTYREHARSLEEARVNSALDDLQMSDVSVIQDATLNLKKSGPMRGLLSVVGLLLGLSLGLLQAILRDSPVASTGGSRAEISRNKAAKSRRRTKSADVATNTDSDLDDVMHEQEDIRSNETVTAGAPTGDTAAMNETSGTYNAPMPR
ncbi:GumC family protein [Rhodopirellula bahusiensis]|uniref:Exopolysaccharide biosynthesis protein n=1 Tax=Rhodopirellula bahusiensis TaxID=2014065 RepID=A0A2G1W305_9BACT|nr:exopolysaccharide biosynthesis protein [Rhodopirellula bahusiensis]PHQ33418.1 exopolysaccharide biosynthesis protein [Rhodopirellula bahusiensis]